MQSELGVTASFWTYDSESLACESLKALTELVAYIMRKLLQFFLFHSL